MDTKFHPKNMDTRTLYRVILNSGKRLAQVKKADNFLFRTKFIPVLIRDISPLGLGIWTTSCLLQHEDKILIRLDCFSGLEIEGTVKHQIADRSRTLLGIAFHQHDKNLEEILKRQFEGQKLSA